ERASRTRWRGLDIIVPPRQNASGCGEPAQKFVRSAGLWISCGEAVNTENGPETPEIEVDRPGKRASTGRRIVTILADPTRRHLLKPARAGAAGAVLGAPVRGLLGAPAQITSLSRRSPEGDGGSLQRLNDDLFVIRLPGEANVVAHTRADGVLLVD